MDGLEFDLTAYLVGEPGETEHGPLDAVVRALTIAGFGGLGLFSRAEAIHIEKFNRGGANPEPKI
jgi:hypothetical protein